MSKDEPKWRRRKEARPREIVDVALEVFAEKGFAVAKLDDICASSGDLKSDPVPLFREQGRNLPRRCADGGRHAP